MVESGGPVDEGVGPIGPGPESVPVTLPPVQPNPALLTILLNNDEMFTKQKILVLNIRYIVQ